MTYRLVRNDDGELVSPCGMYAVRRNASRGGWVAIRRDNGTAMHFLNRKDARRQVERWLRDDERRRNG